MVFVVDWHLFVFELLCLMVGCVVFVFCCGCFVGYVGFGFGFLGGLSVCAF